MKITSLVENTTKSEWRVNHGLSLYIETGKHRLLFDLGPDNTFIENAQKKNIDLSQVDIAIISHGHADHGGALSAFLKINTEAKIYIQKNAFEPHFSTTGEMKHFIGLDEKFMSHPQMILVDGDLQIDDELRLFTVKSREKCYSDVNDVLYKADGKDDFAHEQNLIISEKETALVMGCGHCGIVNILEKAKPFEPKVCIGGFHLHNPRTQVYVSNELLDEIAEELNRYGEIQFYTCHCTGAKAFEYLAERMPKLSYFACGDEMEVG